MKSKAFLVIILFLIWSVVSGWYYVCKIKEKCPSSTAASELPAITFQRGDASPQFSEKFEEFKTSLIEGIGETNRVEIIGLYDENETNQTSFDNLGLARATEVQQTLADLGPERISLSSEKIDFGSELLNLDGVKFRIITRNQYVEETEFGAVLYFDQNLTDTEIPVKLKAYLILLSNEAKGKNIDIVGHTDDTGGEGENFQLGLQRANAVRDILIAKGMSPDKVTASSKGQTEPVADNSTEEGRSKNRRVEILIN